MDYVPNVLADWYGYLYSVSDSSFQHIHQMTAHSELPFGSYRFSSHTYTQIRITKLTLQYVFGN